MTQLLLKDLCLGRIDAYNEFQIYGKEIFQNTFFEYPNFDLDPILDGRVSYICGNKGTGKTMLLKYVESRILSEPVVNTSQFIRFKKDIDEEQRKQINRASVSEDQTIDNSIPEHQNIDCILAWQVFLIKTIIERLQKTEKGVFIRNNENFRKLNSIITAMYDESNNPSWLKKILPRIKHGNIQINFAKYAKVNVDLEWPDKSNPTIPFSYIGKRILNLYSELTPDNRGKIYIFIDELELTLRRMKQYERDVSLIHSMVFAIQYLNDIARTNNYNAYIIAAIRNEVHKETRSKGMEINKPILDFGVQISWRQYGGDSKENPLLKMLEKRILFSEDQKGIKHPVDIWERYFIKEFRLNSGNTISIHKYLLDQTWNKPRDIIRLLRAIQKMHGEKKYIDKAVLESVRQDYAEKAWAEFEEDLTVKYTTQQLAGIRHILTGIQIPFTLNDFLIEINKKESFFEEVESLSSNKPSSVLRDLYDLGIIGNYENNSKESSRFSFKGDADIDPNLSMTLHYPLIRYFKAKTFRRHDLFEI